MSMNKGIVQYFGEDDNGGHSCGYCKKSNESLSHGMWAHCLQCDDYMSLIDRGWRRSGSYCYKPIMNRTCCPQYSIRCDATNIKLTKSQKKVVKRVHKFLASGHHKLKKTSFNKAEDFSDGLPDVPQVMQFDLKFQENCNTYQSTNENQEDHSVFASASSQDKNFIKDKSIKCRKAKVIRRELKLAKLAKKAEENGLLFDESSYQKKQKSLEKSIEMLVEDLPTNSVHKLEVKLIRCCPKSEEFKRSFHEEHLLFTKYQMSIHKESISDCSREKFCRFLVDGPLKPNGIYGAFHQQYYLDGKLIAVGVLDVLPQALSSVYFFYDPEYSFLSLGTYSAVREIYLVRELQKKHQNLRYYYMGFYIHSCPKMRYKAQYHPSFLLCPETYLWVPIEKALPKLDVSKYCCLSDNKLKYDQEINIDHIMVLHRNKVMKFNVFLQLIADKDRERQIKEVTEYSTLSGLSALSMLLCRD